VTFELVNTLSSLSKPPTQHRKYQLSPKYFPTSKTKMSHLDINATLSTIAAMCQQEENAYQTCPYTYLYQNQPNQPSCMGPAHLDSEASPIDIGCRNKMVAWCYQVVDFCEFNRETVAIAINFLDRFIASPFAVIAKNDRKVYQLATMTALYTAVKIHEPEAMDPKLVSALSHGTYRPAQVEDMEAKILTALEWRVNPPTAMAFVRQFLDLLPAHVIDSSCQRDAVYDLAKLQTELAVSEHRFLGIRASAIAYCALTNALESVGMDEKTLAYTSAAFSQAICLYGQSDTIVQVQNWLYEAVLLNQPAAHELLTPSNSASSSSKAIKHTSSIQESPRSTAQCGF
jgi:hypothetical protein